MSNELITEKKKKGDEPDPTALFMLVSQVLPLAPLRLKPRERQFAGLLSSESFGHGSASGLIGITTPVRGKPQTGKWCRSLGWRAAEIWELFDDWRRAGWIVVDGAEGVFRLCPSNLPGWADAIRLLELESKRMEQRALGLDSGDGLDKQYAKISHTTCGVKEYAEISQTPAAQYAKISQTPTHAYEFAEISQARGGRGGVSNVRNASKVVPLSKVRTNENVYTLNVKRLNVSETCTDGTRTSKAADAQASVSLQTRLRAFVGEKDWQSPSFWNGGTGWRNNLFSEEAVAIKRALDYCENALKTGEIHLKKTRGAFFWNEFQRLRHKESDDGQMGARGTRPSD